MSLRKAPAAAALALALAAGAQASSSKPSTKMHKALASYYTLYGSKTACGQTRYPSQVGVAHRSARCGQLVRLRYRGRYVTAPVIDRGPFVAGRTFDLTDEVKRRLRCPDLCWLEWRFTR